MWNKSCPKCNKLRVVKDGRRLKKQAYKCQNCWYRFISSSRSRTVEAKNLRDQYSFWKQTYEQLCFNNWCSRKTIQRIFDEHIELEYIFYNENIFPRETYVVTDVSRFGKDLAVLMVKSCAYKKVIYAKVIDRECVEEYAMAMDFIEEKWWKILWVTSDGFKWLRQLFSCYSYQFCTFHQVKLITMYLGKYPILEPNRELRKIALWLKSSYYEETKLRLDIWFAKFWEILGEKSYSENRRRYTHKKLRSAYKSIKNNLDVLFTYQKYVWMYNTTNMLEWYFRALKAKIRVHCWLSRDRRIKLLFKLLGG